LAEKLHESIPPQAMQIVFIANELSGSPAYANRNRCVSIPDTTVSSSHLPEMPLPSTLMEKLVGPLDEFKLLSGNRAAVAVCKNLQVNLSSTFGFRMKIFEHLRGGFFLNTT
jgi:hypothetical protein